MTKYSCPSCKENTGIAEDKSYYEEMRECKKCGFMAYDDQWEDGIYIQNNDPF